MKKIIVWLLVWIIGFCSLWWVVAYDIDPSFPYDVWTWEWWEAAVNIWKVIKEEAIDPTDSASEQIQVAYKIDLDDDQRATAYIKEVINRTLAVIGLMALTTLIYGFYRMILTTDNEEWYKNARKIIVTAIIALVIIGTAWIIVSQFFDIFFQVKKDVDA